MRVHKSSLGKRYANLKPFLVATVVMVFIYHLSMSHEGGPYFPKSPPHNSASPLNSANLCTGPPTTTSPPTTSKIDLYVQSILDPTNVDTPRMECLPPTPNRYTYLQTPLSPDKKTYFFVLNLRSAETLLPRLMNSILQAIHFLGPSNCALSILEGNSDDDTFKILDALRPALRDMGVPYYLRTSDVNPNTSSERIHLLADLRNMALEPLVENAEGYDLGKATVVFLNDVAACVDDILELVHQRRRLGADMTCGMDWRPVGDHFVFYDVWIARQMDGEPFFQIEEEGAHFRHERELFTTHTDTRERYGGRYPFQAFSCWNGGVTFRADAVAGEQKTLFRPAGKGECFSGEPQLFCKDLWMKGMGKIAVVPSVNFAYTDALGRELKGREGFVREWVVEQDLEKENIAWQGPPEEVKCLGVEWTGHSLRPWDEPIMEDKGSVGSWELGVEVF